MFSVSAEPFNSPDRQLYGGWTLAQAGNNIWGQKTFYDMASRYAPEEATRKAARQWLRWWREFSAKDKTYKKRLRQAGKPYWQDAIMPAMLPAQKAYIWSEFLKTPFNTNIDTQRTSAILRHAPYWNRAVMNNIAELGVPYIDADKNALTENPLNTKWRTLAELEEAFKTAKAYTPLSAQKEAEFLSMLPALKVKVKQEGMGGE